MDRIVLLWKFAAQGCHRSRWQVHLGWKLTNQTVQGKSLCKNENENHADEQFGLLCICPAHQQFAISLELMSKECHSLNYKMMACCCQTYGMLLTLWPCTCGLWPQVNKSKHRDLLVEYM